MFETLSDCRSHATTAPNIPNGNEASPALAAVGRQPQRVVASGFTGFYGPSAAYLSHFVWLPASACLKTAVPLSLTVIAKAIDRVSDRRYLWVSRRSHRHQLRAGTSPAETLNVVALRPRPTVHSINTTFRIGVALSATPIAEQPHRTCRPSGDACGGAAEARAALVGDREDSTANRMKQPDRFGSHDRDRATAARLSPSRSSMSATCPHRRH